MSARKPSVVNANSSAQPVTEVAPVGALTSFISGIFDSINVVTPVQCIYGSEVSLLGINSNVASVSDGWMGGRLSEKSSRQFSS